MAPDCLAMSAILRKVGILSSGFVSVSRKIALVDLLMQCSQELISVASTNSILFPMDGANDFSSTVALPYKSLAATRCEPDSIAASNVASVAPIPDEEAAPASAPSKAATASPKVSDVGLPSRL